MKLLLVASLAASVFVSSAVTRAAVPPAPAAANSQRGAEFYKKRWGIDDVVVRVTSSGILIRFSYRVVDAGKAALISDKTKTPYLIEEKTGLALQIPMMENVGQLRQTATPENGREYWMVFSNKGKFIKPGSRVDVVIGRFRLEGLVVE